MKENVLPGTTVAIWATWLRAAATGVPTVTAWVGAILIII